jgi:protein phosphatase
LNYKWLIMNNKYDIIGDVHGCYDELIRLVEKLGYVKVGSGPRYKHPEKRKLVFVGDLADRGPENFKCLWFAYINTDHGARWARGNHDDKLARALKGNNVKVGEDLQKTLDQVNDSGAFRSKLIKFIFKMSLDELPYYILLDSNKLLVCHAAPPSSLTSKPTYKDKVRCIYGIIDRSVIENGCPKRLDWTDDYNSLSKKPFVVYGHTVYDECYINGETICIDTGAVFGGRLTAFRWPEKEIVQVKSNYIYEACFGVPVGPLTERDESEIKMWFEKNRRVALKQIENDPEIIKEELGLGLIKAYKSPEFKGNKFMHHLVVSIENYFTREG